MVGVAQGTFYWYFKSKEAIALEIIKNGQEKLLQFVAKGCSQSGGTVQDSVRASEALFENFFTFSEKNKALMVLLFKGIETEESVHNRYFRNPRKAGRSISRYINRAMEVRNTAKKGFKFRICLVNEFN